MASEKCGNGDEASQNEGQVFGAGWVATQAVVQEPALEQTMVKKRQIAAGLGEVVQ